MRALAYNEVFRLMCLMHDVADKHQSKFDARIKNFQRLAFPPGINTGKGQRAQYDAGHVFLLALALEMTQLGLSPDRAITVLNRNINIVRVAIRLAVNWKREQPDATMFVWFDPSVLSILSDNEGEDSAARSFFIGELMLVQRKLAREEQMERLALINVSAVLHKGVTHLEATKAINEDEYLDGLLDWAGPEAEDDHGDGEKA